MHFKLLVSTTPFTIFDMIPLSRAAPPAKADARCHSLTSDFCPLTSGLRSPAQLPSSSLPAPCSMLPACSQSAFTLVELIVVILIIATLAAFVVTAASGVLDRARKAQTKNDETQIVTAVNAYYTEYGKYPMAGQGTDTLYGKSNTAPGNEDVFNVLRAIAAGVNASDVLNPRKIIFFSGKEGGSRPRSAFATVATTDTQGKPINIGAFVDPYGNTYMVAIDGSYDGATVDSLPYTDVTYATGNTVRVGCFAESFGKDGVQGRKKSDGTGDKKYSGSDDV